MWKRLFGKKEQAAPEQAPAPAFAPRNALEVALIAATHDPGARDHFQRLLLESDLYVGTPETPTETSERVVDKGETLRILNVAGPEGSSLPAMFTDETRLAEAFGAGSGYARLPAATLFEMFMQSGAILNPGLGYTVMWSADDIAHLLGKPVRRTITKDTKILLGTPAKRPEALIRRLGETIADVPGIQEAWLALAHWPEGQASWYLDIRGATADPDSVAGLLGEILRDGPFDGLPVDLVINPREAGPGNGIRLKPAELH